MLKRNLEPNAKHSINIVVSLCRLGPRIQRLVEVISQHFTEKYNQGAFVKLGLESYKVTRILSWFELGVAIPAELPVIVLVDRCNKQ